MMIGFAFTSIFLQESVDVLINCVTENIGFSEGKPVAAVTIYKCLVHWKIFETEKTSVFDRLIQIFGSAMQVFSAAFDPIFKMTCISRFLFLVHLYQFNQYVLKAW